MLEPLTHPHLLELEAEGALDSIRGEGDPPTPHFVND